MLHTPAEVRSYMGNWLDSYRDYGLSPRWDAHYSVKSNLLFPVVSSCGLCANRRAMSSVALESNRCPNGVKERYFIASPSFFPSKSHTAWVYQAKLYLKVICIFSPHKENKLHTVVVLERTRPNMERTETTRRTYLLDSHRLTCLYYVGLLAYIPAGPCIAIPSLMSDA
jgi:hypothetical protein